ncbi:MAG: hypothetical protein K1W41_25015 [Lachnospiraceae bacterium]
MSIYRQRIEKEETLKIQNISNHLGALKDLKVTIEVDYPDKKGLLPQIEKEIEKMECEKKQWWNQISQKYHYDFDERAFMNFGDSEITVML